MRTNRSNSDNTVYSVKTRQSWIFMSMNVWTWIYSSMVWIPEVDLWFEQNGQNVCVPPPPPKKKRRKQEIDAGSILLYMNGFGEFYEFVLLLLLSHLLSMVTGSPWPSCAPLSCTVPNCKAGQNNCYFPIASHYIATPRCKYYLPPPPPPPPTHTHTWNWNLRICTSVTVRTGVNHTIESDAYTLQEQNITHLELQLDVCTKTALLWQKEASDKSDISFKRANCVWYCHWRQRNITMCYLTYLLGGWVFMHRILSGRRAVIR